MTDTIFTFQGGTTSTSSNTTLTSSSYGGVGNRTTLIGVQVGTIVTSLGNRAFQGCSNLTTVTFETTSNVTIIDDNCFEECIILTNIAIPSLVTTLGNQVFRSCALSTLTFDNQNNLTTIGTNTFLFCNPNPVTYYSTASQANLSTASASLQSQMNSATTFIYNAQPSCFNKGTKILTEKGYVRIEDLKKGDLVKTYLHGYKGITKIGKGFGKNNNENKVLNMHEFKGIYEEPLIITGGHSMLVNDLGDLKEENEKWFHGGTYKIEDKYLLLATVSKDFKEIKDGSEFEYYHLVLENEDEKGQYGIWANEVLMESASEKWFVKAGLKEV